MPETLLLLLKLQNCPKTFEDFRTKKFIYMNYLSRSWKSQSKALWKCIILVCTSHRIWVHDQQKMEVFCSFFFTNLKILLIKSFNFSIFRSRFVMSFLEWYNTWVISCTQFEYTCPCLIQHCVLSHFMCSPLYMYCFNV